jgi:hypothetical protein
MGKDELTIHLVVCGTSQIAFDLDYTLSALG